MNSIKIQKLEIGSQIRIKKQVNHLATTTIAFVGFDGTYYYVAQQSLQVTFNFIQQIVFGGFDNYNKKNTGIYKAYKFKTKEAAEKKVNSFVK